MFHVLTIFLFTRNILYLDMFPLWKLKYEQLKLIKFRLISDVLKLIIVLMVVKHAKQ